MLDSKIFAFVKKRGHGWCFVNSVGEVIAEESGGTLLDEFRHENVALDILEFYREHTNSGRYAIIQGQIRSAYLPRLYEASALVPPTR